ncbi:hypothetical protein ABBQ38_000819 [Trebouxia sp. C0009 RCD-2024]
MRAVHTQLGLLLLLLVLLPVALSDQTQDLEAQDAQIHWAKAIIDTRHYAVCNLLGADSQGHKVKGGHGTFVKPPVQVEELTQYKCVGQGIKNQSGMDVTFKDFLCVIIDSGGVKHNTTTSSVALSAAGVETLLCSI